jgi:CDP-diacylglycerol--glycerol-3-phosphate 3-phosphatidyltransferase
VLLIIGALTTHPGSQNPFLNRMPAVLWILAVGSYWTFAHRMFYTWREVNRADEERALALSAAEKVAAASNAAPEKHPEPEFARNIGATP